MEARTYTWMLSCSIVHRYIHGHYCVKCPAIPPFQPYPPSILISPHRKSSLFFCHANYSQPAYTHLLLCGKG